MNRKQKMIKRAYEFQRAEAIKRGDEVIPLPLDEWMKLKESWKEKNMRKYRNRRKRGIIEPQMVYIG